jgi:hypothetical protein
MEEGSQSNGFFKMQQLGAGRSFRDFLANAELKEIADVLQEGPAGPAAAAAEGEVEGEDMGYAFMLEKGERQKPVLVNEEEEGDEWALVAQRGGAGGRWIEGYIAVC